MLLAPVQIPNCRVKLGISVQTDNHFSPDEQTVNIDRWTRKIKNFTFFKFYKNKNNLNATGTGADVAEGPESLMGQD